MRNNSVEMRRGEVLSKGGEPHELRAKGQFYASIMELVDCFSDKDAFTLANKTLTNKHNE